MFLMVCLFQLALTMHVLLNSQLHKYMFCYSRDFYNKCLCKTLGTPFILLSPKSHCCDELPMYLYEN